MKKPRKKPRQKGLEGYLIQIAENRISKGEHTSFIITTNNEGKKTFTAKPIQANQ